MITRFCYLGEVLDSYYCNFWNLESGIWIILLPAKFRMQIHTEFRVIPGIFTAKNTAEFRGIPYVFQKIPSSVGSQKPTSVDTLNTPVRFTFDFESVG
jgi:hypothetical protein